MEGEGKKSAAECLNQCIQKLLEKYYDKVKGKFQLYFCIRLNKEGSVWECLSGDEECQKDLKELLLKKKIAINDVVHKNGKEFYVLYASAEKPIKDTSFIMQESKIVKWIFLGEERSEPLFFLLKILSDELLTRLYDMLLLNELKNKIAPNNCRYVENLKSENLCNYFFGNILNKEWLTKEYVKQVLVVENLPNQRTFLHISAMFYEKRTVKTCLYFVKPKYDFKKLKFELKFPENGSAILCDDDNSDFRILRKLMEMTGPEHGLLLYRITENDGGIIKPCTYRTVGIIKKYDRMQKDSSVACVEFLDHMVWQLRKNTRILLRYQKGEYMLPELESSDDMQKNITKLREDGSDEIVELVKKINKNVEHGTTMIFMENDMLEEEKSRLVKCHRAIDVEKFSLNTSDKKNKMVNIFSIDGAVLLNFSCECMAVGAIVDGKACNIEDGMSRGARYNSIVSYVKGLKEKYGDKKYLAVIFSEDGMMNVISDKDETKQNKILHTNIEYKNLLDERSV